MERKRILVVEDESIVVLDIAKRLKSLGYGVSAIVSSGEEAFESVRKDHPDLVLMDIVLQREMDGIQAAALIQSLFDIPVIYLTAYSDDKTLDRAKFTGPFGYITKPFDTRDLQIAIEMALYKHIIDRSLKESNARLEKSLKGTIDAIAAIVELRGPFLSGYHQRVSRLAAAIAGEMGLSDSQVEGIRLVATIYDIGLVQMPIEVLMNVGRLEGTNMTIYQTYPRIGYDILNKVPFPWPIAEIVLQHCERFDGSGFPGGIKGDDILMEARILAVADTIAAMTSHRTYRPALEMNKALEEIANNKGILYDPKVVNACLQLFNEKGYKLE
ncbi:MAG: response regulator [Deltaproteobacteria bacterium]|nr:response regulator [Deltaproteobacteria bacterium]